MVLEAKQARTEEHALTAAGLARWAAQHPCTERNCEPIRVSCDCPRERLRVGRVERSDDGLTLILVDGELGLDMRALSHALAEPAAGEAMPVDAVLADPFGDLVHFDVAGLSMREAAPTITVETRT